MKWGVGEGDSAPIAALRPPQTVVELTIDLPWLPLVGGDGKGDKLTVQTVASGMEDRSEAERDYAMRQLLNGAVETAIRELREKGVMRDGGS